MNGWTGPRERKKGDPRFYSSEPKPGANRWPAANENVTWRTISWSQFYMLRPDLKPDNDNYERAAA